MEGAGICHSTTGPTHPTGYYFILFWLCSGISSLKKIHQALKQCVFVCRSSKEMGGPVTGAAGPEAKGTGGEAWGAVNKTPATAARAAGLSGGV